MATICANSNKLQIVAFLREYSYFVIHENWTQASVAKRYKSIVNECTLDSAHCTH